MTLLKLKDETIMEFDISEGSFLIHKPEKLPFALRDLLKDTRTPRTMKEMVGNYNALMNFFRNRSLSIQRENAKKILNALHISQDGDDNTIEKMMVLCKGLSVIDDYWITNNPNDLWKDNDIRKNPLHEVISQIALHGDTNLTVTGPLRTPELTGQGAYAKAWYREDNELYLYKAGTMYGNEARIECSVSAILDCTNVPHVVYEKAPKGNKICSKCKNMVTDEYSIVPASDIIRWCNRIGKNFDMLVRNMDPENFYKTIIVDYLISNSDRHDMNWGFYMDNSTGQLTGLHPLYDHNNAFDKSDMQDRNGGESMMMPGKTKREAALYAMKRCDFHFIKPLKASLFLNEGQCQSFVARAKDLGLKFVLENSRFR